MAISLAVDTAFILNVSVESRSHNRGTYLITHIDSFFLCSAASSIFCLSSSKLLFSDSRRSTSLASNDLELTNLTRLDRRFKLHNLIAFLFVARQSFFLVRSQLHTKVEKEKEWTHKNTILLINGGDHLID